MSNPYDKFNLIGRIALITGASEGIGHDLAVGLAEAGTDVYLCSRRKEKLLEVKEQIESYGRKAYIYPFDVRNVAEIQKLKNFILETTGKIDILINNAGYVVTKPAWEVTEPEWDAMVDTDLKGVFFCSQIIGSVMRENSYGKIINLSSTFSMTVVLGRAVYAGIKAGLNHLTEALAAEWAVYGIRVNAIAPTATATPSRQEILQGPLLQRVLSRIPLGRIAEPSDLLSAAIYLSSSASDFVTGQTLFVDGGWVAAK